MYFTGFSTALFVLSSGFTTNAFPRAFPFNNPKIFQSSIISIKDKCVYENNALYPENKKIITLSPGGYRGFYMFGICKFLKNNYKLDDYVFSGASAGAWMSLFLSFRGDINEIEKYLIDDKLQKLKTINNMENMLKHKLLLKYKTEDFDLNKLYVGVTTIHCNHPNTGIFTNFDNLEDAINSCIASSHIPIITGGLRNVYQNFYTFDGGFSKYPYLNSSKPVVHITPFFWDKIVYSKVDLETYTTLFSKGEYNYREMVEQGYLDSFENKEYLDRIFLNDS